MFDLEKLQKEKEYWIEYSREFIVPSMQSHWETDVKELYEFNKSDLIGAIKCIDALATGQSMEKVIELYTLEIKLRENAIRLIAKYSTRGQEFLDAANDFYPFVNDGKMFHFTSNNDKIDRDFFTEEVGKDFILDVKHQEWDQKCKEYKDTPDIISGAVELIVALAYGQQYEEVYRKWHSYYYTVGEAANLNILNPLLRFTT